MSQNKPLPDGKRYHFNVIYNHANSPLDATEDNHMSLQYAVETVTRLTTVGFDKSYYHKRDSRPGRNIFEELFRVIRESNCTLVILTPGFLKNQWAKYSRQAAFKQLLDKNEDHRLKALAFGLTNEQIPQELCSHHVLHFLDSDEDDHAWTQLIQEMSKSEEDYCVGHQSVNEYGDNRAHTGYGGLITHPEGEQSLGSLAFNSLDMDGDTEKKKADRSKPSIRGDSGHAQHPGRQIGSLQVDGEPSGRGTIPATNIQKQAYDPGVRPRQNGLARETATASSGRKAQERELMTKTIDAELPVTLDIKARPPPTSPTTCMSLEASPMVLSPRIIKKLPSTLIGQKTGGSKNTERTDENINYNAKLETSGINTDRTDRKSAQENIVHAEKNMSLSNDRDLTLDDGSFQTRNKTKKDDVGSVRNEIVGNTQIPENEVTTHETGTDSENANFENLQLDSLREETVPKELIDSGYSTEKCSPEKIPQPEVAERLNLEPDNEISSRFQSGSLSSESGIGDSVGVGARRGSEDMQNLKEFPAENENADSVAAHIPAANDENNVKTDIAEMAKVNNGIEDEEITTSAKQIDDSITEVKMETGSDGKTDNQLPSSSEVVEETQLKQVSGDLTQRSEPDGEDRDVSTGETNLSAENLESARVRGEGSGLHKWTSFGLKCISRAFSHTDSLV